MKAFAVTSAQRSPVAPDLPALKETFPSFDMPFWIGIYAPAKTPKPIVDRLSSEVATAVWSEAVKKRLADMGSEAVGSTPEEFDAYWKNQLKLYADFMKAMQAKGG